MANKTISKRFYKIISKVYDILDRMYFTSGGRNPREIIGEMIQKDNAKVLDMCCGTFANGLIVADNKPGCMVVGLDRSKPMLRKAKQKKAPGEGGGGRGRGGGGGKEEGKGGGKGGERKVFRMPKRESSVIQLPR